MKILKKITSVLVLIVMLCAMLSGCADQTSSSKVQNTVEEGKLSISVVDKATNKPVSDAKITIIGIEDSYKTDENGKSPEITMKVNKDMYKKYGEELAKKTPSGCVTIIVSKEGYKDYLLFNKAVYPGYAANTLNIQLIKPTSNDTEKYVVDYQYPHELWVQELIQYCSKIKDDSAGSGENKLTVNVKDQNSKAVQDAVVVIPELNIKTKTDKTGKAALNPPDAIDTMNIYPVKRELSEYTLVVSKEGFAKSIMFNVTVGAGKDSKVDITLKAPKTKETDEYSASFFPYEKDWIDKIVGNYKK